MALQLGCALGARFWFPPLWGAPCIEGHVNIIARGAENYVASSI
jgi:hypothetical protein